MANLEKKIIKMGNSAGVYIENKVLFATGIEVGDKVEFKCSKGKITLIKVDDKGGKVNEKDRF